MGKGAEPDEVALYTEQLAQHDPYHFCTIRNVDPGKLFNRKKVGQVVQDPAQVIDTVGIRNKGMPRLPFSHFFRAAMVKANVRNNIDNILPVQLKYQP